MKKALVVLLALTCLSALAFADDVAWVFGATVKTGALITIPSTGSTMIVANDADDPTLSRIRLTTQATLGDFSVNVYLNSDYAGSMALDTSLKFLYFPNWWVTAKFLDQMIALRFGAMDTSTTDTVNKGWGGINTTGTQIVVTPISGLNVGLAIPVPTTAGTLDSALAGMKAGFAYTMPNLLTAKATWVNAAGTNNCEADFGVAVLAVPNLTAQFEGQIKLLGSSTAQTIELFENVAYAMGPLTPAINADEVLYSASGLNTQIAINPNVDYVVMTGTAVGLSVTYTMNVAGASVNKLVADPYVKFTFNDKAKLKIDAAYTIPDLSATGTWSLPININFMWSY